MWRPNAVGNDKLQTSVGITNTFPSATTQPASIKYKLNSRRWHKDDYESITVHPRWEIEFCHCDSAILRTQPHCISINVSCDKSVYIDLSNLHHISRKYDFVFVKNSSSPSPFFLGSIYVLSYTHAHVNLNVHPHIYTKIYVNIDRLLNRRSRPSVVQLQSLGVMRPRRWKNDVWRKKGNEGRREKGEAWTHILQRAEEGWLQRACTSSMSCGGIHLDFQMRSSHTHGHVWRILQGRKS